MTVINPADHQEEFLNKIEKDYQGSQLRRYPDFTEELFEKGIQG